MKPYTFHINATERKNKKTGHAERSAFTVYPCQELRFIGDYTFTEADKNKSGGGWDVE
jgi:hypothetical protein